MARKGNLVPKAAAQKAIVRRKDVSQKANVVNLAEKAIVVRLRDLPVMATAALKADLQEMVIADLKADLRVMVIAALKVDLREMAIADSRRLRDSLNCLIVIKMD